MCMYFIDITMRDKETKFVIFIKYPYLTGNNDRRKKCQIFLINFTTKIHVMLLKRNLTFEIDDNLLRILNKEEKMSHDM